MINKKRCIFTYANYQVDEKIINLQRKVIQKFNLIDDCDYQILRYNAKDPEIVPDQVIDYGLNELIKTYDSILILDIDCVPVNSRALTYIFEQAESGILVGNIQRSNHLNNNSHLYVAPSCIALTREMFNDLRNPSFAPTNRGDIGEELSYIAESLNKKIEMFLPSKYEQLPYQSKEPWDLNELLPKYGIGTTFANSKKQELFYHLFQSRVGVFNELFYKKCSELLALVE
jgi:hypothetical protein